MLIILDISGRRSYDSDHLEKGKRCKYLCSTETTVLLIGFLPQLCFIFLFMFLQLECSISTTRCDLHLKMYLESHYTFFENILLLF